MSWNIQTPGDYINGPLTVVGAATFQNDLSLTGNENYVYLFSNYSIGSNSRVRFRAVGSGGGSGYGGDFRISTRAPNNVWNTDAFILDSAANVGLGTSPAQKLDVVSTAACVVRVRGGNGANQGAAFYVSNTAGTNTLAAFGDSGNMIGGTVDLTGMVYTGTGIPLAFYVNSAERLRLNINGALVLQGGNTAANGIGVAFPAAQSASTDANTLDDYEEGTWTPTFTFTTPGTLAVAYADRVGTYTKVGRVVTVRFHVTIAPGNLVKGTANGQLQITGLPFAVSVAGTQYFDLAASLADQSSGSLVLGYPHGGSSLIYFERLSVSGSRVIRDNGAITDANFASTNAGFISIQAVVTYQV